MEDAGEQTVTAEADGFSLYTVEFTYNSLQYVLEGGGSVPLSAVLRAVGLVGEAESASVSDDELFSVAFDEGEWTLTSHRPFLTEEWLKVVIGGVEYGITVTDDIEFVSATCYVNGEKKTVQAVPVTEDPTIPYATTGHGAFLSPEKNERVPALRPVSHEIRKSRAV